MMRTSITYAFAISAVLAILYSCSVPPKGELVTASDGIVSIDTRSLARGVARFYHYNKDGKDIVFFIARPESGDLKVAFDACVACNPYKKGYRLEAGTVVCIHCGTAFKIDELDVGKGNCIPIKIRHSINGGTIRIDQKDLEEGACWF